MSLIGVVGTSGVRIVVASTGWEVMSADNSALHVDLRREEVMVAAERPEGSRVTPKKQIGVSPISIVPAVVVSVVERPISIKILIKMVVVLISIPVVCNGLAEVGRVPRAPPQLQRLGASVGLSGREQPTEQGGKHQRTG